MPIAFDGLPPNGSRSAKALAPFRPTLITMLGTNTTPDGTWQLLKAQPPLVQR